MIQGNLEGILDGVYPADQEQLASLLEEKRVLSRLIDDLRTLSLADSGALNLQLEPIEIGYLITEVLASFQIQAKALGVSLHADVQEDLSQVDIDPIRIREVIGILLSNALRYTSSGWMITIHAGLVNDISECVKISIDDTGAGIEAQDLTRVFDRFFKSSDSRGNGLGLAIAKSLIEAHWGEKSIQSESCHGNTITFRLPITKIT